jgi:putative lipoic acid-binding regulatory protein
MIQEPSEAISALKFPCDFPIKIMGNANEEFEKTVFSIFRKHFPALKEGALKQRSSQQGKYLALTVTVHAENQKQLDDLYRDLSSSPAVIMAL